ncbi:MAG: archaetidylserine decarboxylase [Gammaproteobacteria bacterium]|nr:archaetidylserine decarboxylase [Gammaproteobacteria bacterium]
MSALSDRIKVIPQHFIPHHTLSGAMHWLTRIEATMFKNLFIKTFIRLYNVNMQEAQNPDPRSYKHFNEFFTRALQPNARPLAGGNNAVVSPVDGTVNQLGSIDGRRIFQAKGHHFDVIELLGGSYEFAAPFLGGQFATLYLSPRDYHRIHAPVRGVLHEMVYVPGRLFSVNDATTRLVPGLFARNERLVCLFNTEFGPMALVMVGAIFVSSMETVFEGVITPTREHAIRYWSYEESPHIFYKGQELGRFNMGSTVILLFGKGVEWNPALTAGMPIKMGQLLAQHKP